MTPSQAGEVLVWASAVDNRNLTPEASLLWSQSLWPDITVDEAKRAVSAHFATSTDYLQPAHINAITQASRKARNRELPPVTPPRDLADEPAREIEWCRVWGDAVLAGHTEQAARNIANSRFEITESEPPRAIEGHVRTLRDTLDRTQREMADKKRMSEIQAEVDRQAKLARRAEQAEAEKTRGKERSA